MSLMRRIRGVMMRTMPLMITCRELEAFIVDYLDGSLPAGKRRVFDLHIRLCPECRAYLKAYERTIETGQAAFGDPDAPPPDDVPEDLVAAILAARDSKP
ncbi:MAG: zf-HC2 domain-containing protein [Kiloniellales bacterium]|nr:zf-HC2 domain-containing protein [Kiloniellales bacterium]